ncbi:hypothetical protein [Methylobacterium sp. B1]|uniref:hypothetical protein n=1 Tax=Methylobacterium sp. B1 TaxID=91459 RepID=UPI0011D1FB53|nr:hypothetical protein [Methylobacterium sp. B1]
MSEIHLPVPIPHGNDEADVDLILKLRQAAEERTVDELDTKIPDDVAADLEPHAAAINGHLVGLRRHTVAIGLELVAVKKKLKDHPKAAFGAWLKRHFGWDARTAQRYMKVAAFCQQHPEAMGLPASAICLLASSGTPTEVLAAVLGQLGNEERPKLAEIEARIQAAKIPAPSTATAMKQGALSEAAGAVVPVAAQGAAELILSHMREHRRALREHLLLIDGEALKRTLLNQLADVGEDEAPA